MHQRRSRPSRARKVLFPQPTAAHASTTGRPAGTDR